ncbi:MAG: GNAT family N-acetyltransferase [Nitriliruptorales bacterium]|nr:GNAT family N-acetyltransferase [Nitriliruptorales bacterium]
MSDLRCRPVTPDRWDDLVALFGDNGAYDGCWCMYQRVTSREYSEGRGEGNRQKLHELVTEGREPGLLAYDGDTPVGWVSAGPRPDYGRILRSPLFRPDDPDDASTWSVACFYLPREHRGRGLTDVLLRGAVDRAREVGAHTIEGYAIAPDGRPAAELYVGVPAVFERADFEEVGAPSEIRRLYRRSLT